MAFGSSSKIFYAFIKDVMENTTAMDMNTDVIDIALYGNTGTPDQTAASASTAYNTGQWVTSGSQGVNEVYNGGWAQGGIALSGVSSSMVSNVYTFTASSKSGGSSDTITNAFGCLIFDGAGGLAVAKQGICYLSFGGSGSTVSSGTFTVAFNTAGIFNITL